MGGKGISNEELWNLIDQITDNEKYWDILPTNENIARLLKSEFGVEMHSITLGKKVDLDFFHFRWLFSSSDDAFLDGIKGSAKWRFRDTVDERLKNITKGRWRANKSVFPTGPSICSLLSNKVSRTRISEIIGIEYLQIEWIENASKKEFLRANSYGSFNRADILTRKAAKEKFAAIVEEEIDADPYFFPVITEIGSRLNEQYSDDEVTLMIAGDTIAENIEIHVLQLKWIEERPEPIFLSIIGKGKFSDKIVEKEAYGRLTRIIERLLHTKPNIFPSNRAITKLLIDNKISAPSSVTRKIEFPRLQLSFIKSCPEKIFLEHNKGGSFSGLHAECKEAVQERLHEILLAHPHDFNKLDVGKDTLRKYSKLYPDLTFIREMAGTHRLTRDQRIVLAMHLWKEKRDSELHKAIGERLEQLWGFRELFTLMSGRGILDADVISPFHETLPQKAAAFLPGAQINHFFVDELFAGKFTPSSGRTVILLAFMHWLTESQTAEMLLRLNRGVSTESSIIMTTPEGVECAVDIAPILDRFGFFPKKIGNLYLIPPSSIGDDGEHTDERRKLITRSNILLMEKERDVEAAPKSVQLFAEQSKRTGTGVMNEANSDVISYDGDALRNSTPLVTLRDFWSVLSPGAPEVQEIVLGEDAGVLELKGNVTVGFNMDPKTVFSVEIEGKRIPKSVDGAILDLVGGGNGFPVPDDLKENYQTFVEMVKRKKEQIAGISKTRIKAKKPRTKNG